MIDDQLLNAARSKCIDLRLAIEDHQADPARTGLKAVDERTARNIAWGLIKTARMLIEDDDDRDDEIDRVAVLLDECEDVLNRNVNT